MIDEITFEEVAAIQRAMSADGMYRYEGYSGIIHPKTVEALNEIAAQPRHSKHHKARKARHL